MSHFATLIDNINCNIPEIGAKYDFGILCTSISDQYAIFLYKQTEYESEHKQFDNKT